MTAREIGTAIELATAEGWNPGIDDAACFHAADPTGFLAGFIDGELVATISVVKYGDAFGFLGLYIVKPAYRGRGYGFELWNAGIAALGRRTIGLDGVVAQQENYRRSGFVLAYRNVRYMGVKARLLADDRRIVPLSSVAFGDLEAYDRSVFVTDRASFLRAWIAQPRALAIGLVRDDRLAGYGVIRPAADGYKIGPLFADDAAIAEALLNGLVNWIPLGATYYLDVPEPNRAAVALAERDAMTVVFETARMYAGPAPDVPVERVFGVTTFELG